MAGKDDMICILNIIVRVVMELLAQKHHAVYADARVRFNVFCTHDIGVTSNP